jgi:hypothetical protein
VAIGAEPNVVREIPPRVIGVLVEDDLVTIPEPVAAIREVERGDGEVRTPEPEAVWASSSEPKDVLWAEPAAELAVLPRMVAMKMWIVPAGVVPDPNIITMDMRSVGMTGLVPEVVRGGCFRRRAWRRDWRGTASRRGGSVRGNVGPRLLPLSEDRQRAEEESGKKSGDVPDALDVLHAISNEQAMCQIAVPH